MGQKSSKQPQVAARYLAPQTLCCFNEVDLRKLRRLIKDRKLAPCFPGIDSESRELEECPICFLKYPSLNRAVCCHKPICTECFLQVKSLKAGHSPMCPYCKADFSIYFHGPASTEQKLKAEAEDREQALALKRSRQGEHQGAPHGQEQQPPAAAQSASASLAKMPLQSVSAGLNVWDYLPDEFFMADAIHSEVDLDEAMLMQGIAASLQLPTSSSSSSITAPHDYHHMPSQLESDEHMVQQASSSTELTPDLLPAKSVQPRVFTGLVIGHSNGDSNRWQDPVNPCSRQAGAGIPPQMAGEDVAALHGIPASTVSNEFLSPPSGSQSDGTVHLSVTSSGTQPTSQSSKPPTPADALPSSIGCIQLGSPHKPVAISSASQSQCFPPVCSLARTSGRVQADAGDTLAGFLQEQTEVPHVHPEVILPQPALDTHELFVGMVTTDFTFAAGQQQSNSSCKIDSQCGTRQSPNNGPGLPSALECSGMQGSVHMSGRCSGCVTADCKQQHVDAQTAPQSVELSVADLTSGAVMLQNPDGTVQYVVLTSDEQRAVQLSMQAKRNKEAGTAEGSAYQVECSPEDQAVQAAIAEGDAILQRLYQIPQDVQHHPVADASAGCGAPDVADRSSSVQYADPMLRRMEQADAKLRALYSPS